MSRVGSGRVRRCSKCHESGRVGSTRFLVSRVGSGMPRVLILPVSQNKTGYTLI